MQVLYIQIYRHFDTVLITRISALAGREFITFKTRIWFGSVTRKSFDYPLPMAILLSFNYVMFCAVAINGVHLFIQDTDCLGYFWLVVWGHWVGICTRRDNSGRWRHFVFGCSSDCVVGGALVHNKVYCSLSELRPIWRRTLLNLWIWHQQTSWLAHIVLSY